MSAPEIEINAAARNSVRNALSITSANAEAVVVTGSGEATDSAKYCDQLLDEAEKLREEKIAEYRDVWFSGTRKWLNGIETKSPHELLTEEGKQKEADHLRRCIELSLEIQEEYEKLDAATKDLEKLNNMEGDTYTTREYGPPSGGLFDMSPGVYSITHNIAEEKAAAMQQINSSLDVINKLENTQNAINPSTSIDERIRAAWEIDDRGFLKDVTIGAIPGVNVGDSTRNAYIYARAGRYGMAAMMGGFAVADGVSTAATVFAGAGIVTGAATGGVKAVTKASIKQALKRSTASLRALFRALSKTGELITKRRALREAAEMALKCAKACVGR